LGEIIGVPFPASESPQLAAARSDPQLMADRLLATFLEWLEALCQEKPVLFFVEDLHWADPASVRFLEAALRALEERPLLVVAFARPEVREAFPQLWAERDLIEVRLSKLGARVCERLLDAIAGPEMSAATRGWLVERAEGNPFFLEELVRGLSTRKDERDLPLTILGIIQARLDALGSDAKLIMRAASVYGQVFHQEGVQALLGPHASLLDVPGWLQLLTDREVVFPRDAAHPGEFVFRHALIRDAAYALLPEQERVLGHRLAGEWLERQAPSSLPCSPITSRRAARSTARPGGTAWPPSKRSRRGRWRR
jgi:predicted ATPase